MNEKIKGLITELAQECVEENATLTLAVVKGNKTSVAQVGSGMDITAGVEKQLENFIENVGDECECPACRAARMTKDEWQEDEPTIEADIKSDGELMEMLSQLFKGGSNE